MTMERSGCGLPGPVPKSFDVPTGVSEDEESLRRGGLNPTSESSMSPPEPVGFRVP